MPEWRKLCCAIDFSALSEESVLVAAGLARKLGAQLLLAHVEQDEDGGHIDLRPEITESEQLEQRFLLQSWQRAAQQERGEPVEVRTLRGRDVAETLAAFARAEGCDLFIVGTHGRSGARRALLGSVTSKLARLSPCPVMTVGRAIGAVAATRLPAAR